MPTAGGSSHNTGMTSGKAAPEPASIPPNADLIQLRQAAAGCRACDLWERATQTVFGDGSPRARIMLVGEQPGNDEDLAGKPFVGPAGKLLDAVLNQVGIDRRQVYTTNVVKHFKWEPRGKRRIHSKPNAEQISACRPWLDAEISLIRPSVIVCFGATAARALLGKEFRVTRQRGQFVPSPLAPLVMATVHPSSILRAPDDRTRRQERQLFVEDMERVAQALQSLPPAA
jgi:uracil-DNA glycosylase family protein